MNRQPFQLRPSLAALFAIPVTPPPVTVVRRATLAIATTFAVALGLSAIAAQPAAASPDPPPGATQPVQSYPQSVTTMSFGLNPVVCFDRDYNPLGYIKYYKTYSGWTYLDANGVTFDAWFQTWDNGWKTVSGPFTVDNTTQSFECGLPQ